jgi:ATP-dependent Clp protease ATP-binding subunit ClpC
MKYLSESGYLGAVRLEKIFPRRAALAALWLFGILTAGLICWATFTGVPMNMFGKVFVAITICLAVYLLFTEYLQRDKNLLSRMSATAKTLSAGQMLDFASVWALSFAVQNDSVSVKKFLHALANTHKFQWVIKRLNVSPEVFNVAVGKKLESDDLIPLDSVMDKAAARMRARNESVLDLVNLIPALVETSKSFSDLLFDLKIREEDLAEALLWQVRHDYRRKIALSFWHPANLLRVKGIGKNWSSAYTPNLDGQGHDITRLVEVHKPDYIYSHRQYVEQLEQALVDGTHNVILSGAPGSGRHAVINNFAVNVNAGRVLRPLAYARVIQVESTAFLGDEAASGTASRIQTLLSEALWAGNIILVINNIDALFDNKQRIGRVNATESILPFLKSALMIVGTTTQEGYQSTIAKNPELMRWFGKIDIAETAPEETLEIIEDHALVLENETGLYFTLESLNEVVTLSGKLIQALPNPEKSLEVLKATAIYVRTKLTETVVLPRHVQKVIADRTHVPVEKVAGTEKDTLLNLEKLLHARIIGQDEGITQIANALRRARTGIGSDKRPIGSFLFLGPTGVGKTETTKALAEIYFGGENKIVRLDMSEFQEVHSINRLIGDADKNEGGLLTEKILVNPFSLILLDEIEKAHAKILDLFLQVLDEGRITDALGRHVDFSNTIIIATSNAGAEFIREKLRDRIAPGKDEVVEYIQKNNSFRPEFINRFDAVVVFTPLFKPDLIKVAGLVIDDLNRRLEPKEISVVPSPELLEYIVDKAYSPEYGARPLRRFVSDKIENYIAKGLLSGSIQRGAKIELNAESLANL